MAVALAPARTVRLRDGRVLAYDEWGPTGGPPVFGFHGGGLSRLAHYGDAPARAGVRLLMPDRPGFGRSDPAPGRTLLAWADDVCELADELGIGRFAVFGVSAGAPPALACASAAPDRIAAAGVVSGVGPYQDEPELAPLLDDRRRRLVELGRTDPEAALAEVRKGCEQETALIAERPDAMLDDWPSGTPESDRATMADPAIRARFLAAFRESAARGPEGCVEETLLHYLRPWGFRVQDVRVPVLLWHGERDPFVPLAVARLLAERIPDATLTVYPGEGHAVDYGHIDEILGPLAVRVR